jgi:hypothetical protein
MLKLNVCYYLKNNSSETYFIADKYDGDGYIGLFWIYNETINHVFVEYQFLRVNEDECVEVELTSKKHSCLRIVFNMGVKKR